MLAAASMLNIRRNEIVPGEEEIALAVLIAGKVWKEVLDQERGTSKALKKLMGEGATKG